MGAGSYVNSCDLGILTDQPAEAVASGIRCVSADVVPGFMIRLATVLTAAGASAGWLVLMVRGRSSSTTQALATSDPSP